MIGLGTFEQLVLDCLVALVVAVEKQLTIFVLLDVAQAWNPFKTLDKQNTTWLWNIFSVYFSKDLNVAVI